MHPAFSVIFLTTLIGMGQGFFLALYTEQVYTVIHVLPSRAESISFYSQGSVIALILLSAGLFASFFHLGHPERAWRSAAMWRTSWLSREVIILPAFMFWVFLYGLTYMMNWNTDIMKIGEINIDLTTLIGFIAATCAFLLFVATGMIYGSLKFLQEWHTPLTVINYLLLGIASGFVLASVFSIYSAPELVNFYVAWAIVFTTSAFITRSASLIRNKQLKAKSTIQTAIGVRHSQIQQKAQGSMCGSFNTREYFHGKTAAFLRSIKYIFIIFVFIAPITLLSMSFYYPEQPLLLIALGVQYTGLLAERWFFFAQANHPQNIYYQTVS
jgi:sulfite dehydrogenase (quinone) subunit SoeC